MCGLIENNFFKFSTMDVEGNVQDEEDDLNKINNSDNIAV